MGNIWRFYDEIDGISGICLGENEEEARHNAEHYLKIQFDDIKLSMLECLYVWPVTNDDDYREDFPFAIATNY